MALVQASLTIPENSSPPTHTPSTSAPRGPPSAQAETDPDLRRVFDLMELHETLKLRHARGQDAGLEEARRQVDAAVKLLR